MKWEKIKKIESRLDVGKMKNPSFLMVLTARGNMHTKREDGVYVVSIGC